MAEQKVLEVRKQLHRLGTRKLYHLLAGDCKKEHMVIGRDKLFSILREEKLLIIKKKRNTKTTDSNHWMYKYSNLTKELQLMHPEQIWVADITWLAIKNNYSYLHLITDAYSKKIMGYDLSDSRNASNTIKALKMALRNRKYTPH